MSPGSGSNDALASGGLCLESGLVLCFTENAQKSAIKEDWSCESDHSRDLTLLLLSAQIMLKEVSTAYTALKEDQRVSAARNILKEDEAAIAACNALTGEKAASTTDSAQKKNEEDTETQEVEADGVDKEPCLPVVQLQYPDFATWQASQVQSAELQGQVSTLLHSRTPHAACLTQQSVKDSTPASSDPDALY